jgi:methionyl-tRNA formyltransferase
MILSAAIAIAEDENAGDLHNRLMTLGSEVVIATLERIKTGNVVTTIQEEASNIKTAYKLNKDNCKIDWTKPGKDIYNLIRGLSPYPASWCFFKDNDQEWNVKVYEAKWLPQEHDLPLGTVVTTKKEIKIAVKNGFIQITSLQFPGKKKMSAAELLNGISFSENAIAS